MNIGFKPVIAGTPRTGAATWRCPLDSQAEPLAHFRRTRLYVVTIVWSGLHEARSPCSSETGKPKPSISSSISHWAGFWSCRPGYSIQIATRMAYILDGRQRHQHSRDLFDCRPFRLRFSSGLLRIGRMDQSDDRYLVGNMTTIPWRCRCISWWGRRRNRCRGRTLGDASPPRIKVA